MKKPLVKKDGDLLDEPPDIVIDEVKTEQPPKPATILAPPAKNQDKKTSFNKVPAEASNEPKLDDVPLI